MRQRILFFIYYFLYWIAFFVVARLVFMLYNHDLSFLMDFGEWCATFGHGLRMDISMSGYISAIAALILTFTSFSKGVVVSKALSVYTFLALLISGFLIISDMELYRHWGFRLDDTPLTYLKTPKEAFASVNVWILLLQLAILAVLLWISWKVYRKINAGLKKSRILGITGVPVFLFACALMILPIRGSLGVAPMNVGFVYHHPNNIFANHAAINVVWNAAKSLMESDKVSEYHFMDGQKAGDLFSDCYPPAGYTHILLKEEQPNILVIILESFSNRMIESLGGTPGVTPNLNRLCNEGIVFSNIYSASDRTDKGLLAVLSGYPSHPVAKVINFPEKTRHLPFLNKDLKNAGYHTEHVSGFDNKFSNIMSYLGNAGYDIITDRDAFPPETYRGTKWGVPDHWVFEKLLERCNDSGYPFFKSMITLSSHEPFDVPMETAIKGDDEESQFLNSAFYTDKSLGAFIDAAKQTDWWEKTLIVITADHGSRFPGNIPSYQPEKFHIPMIWTGGAVIKGDTVITTIAGQTDIAYTVLRQLGIDNHKYRFSKDILGIPVRSFAFYDFNDGFGFVTDSAQIAYDNVSNMLIFQKGIETDGIVETGKAYMQTFSDDFKTKNEK
ncbi:MAG: sulfatase-like hydrolase/transferase [Bacteroidales bacterium]|jgi:phosphoglycerol transferase MdoB-like AlkP superfamily enzyme|nr:sulfatase-like hydrolase/transferase [Bacteroidales bacterium]